MRIKKLKGCMITFITIQLIFIILIFAVFIGNSLINDYKLNLFFKQLSNIKLPNETEVISENKYVGKLNGNGNGIDYFAGIIIDTKLSETELKKYYENINFEAVSSSSNHDVLLGIVKLDSSQIDIEVLERYEIKFDENELEHLIGDAYLIYIYDGGYDSLFDIRGH